MADDELSQAASEGEEDEVNEPVAKGSQLPDVKMVPESQIVATKKEYKGKVKAIQEAHDTLFQSNLRLQGQVDELTEKANKVEGLTAQLTEVSERLYIGEAYRNQFEASSVDQKRAFMTKQYNIDPEAVKDKSLSELSQMEETLLLVNNGKSSSKGYAASGAGGGDGGTAALGFDSNMEEALAVVAATEKRLGIPPRND